MNKVKEALTRKIGPLPAWVYLLAFTGLAYWYQNRKGKGKQVVLDPATQPGVMDSQTKQDIVPLQPGESAYNPNTGQLVSTAPEQFPPNPPPDRPLPVTLEPGETLYDPATGQLIGGTPAAATKKTVAKPKPKFFLRSGVTLDKGNKPRKGAHAHYHGKAGYLGPTGGFHPFGKRKPKPKPKPKAKPKAPAKPRSNAHLPAHTRSKAPVKPPPKHRTRTPAPVAHAAAPHRSPAPARHAAPMRPHTTPVRRPARRR